MSELSFACTRGCPEPYAAVPILRLTLQIVDPSGAPIQAIALRVQIRIEPQRRRYSAAEAERLLDLFGETSRWGDTLKPLQFATVSVLVPAFEGSTEVDLPVPCTYDFEVASAKYFHGLEDGEIPLLLLFSGTVFRRTPHGFAVEPIPWHQEATYRLPVRTWRDLMDQFFPDSGWIRIRRETLDKLQQFRVRQALPTWDEALEALLQQAGREVG